MRRSFESLINRIKTIGKNPLLNKLMFLSSVVYTFLLLFLSRAEIKSINWDSFLDVSVISFLLYFQSLFLQSINWSISLDGNLSKFSKNSEAFYRSLLLQRIPGGFWHWLGRVNYYREDESGLSKHGNNKVAIANLYEWLLFILTGVSIFFWTKNHLLGIIASVVSVILIFSLFRRIDQKDHSNPALPFLTILIMLIRWGMGFLTLLLLINNIIYPDTVSSTFVLSTWTLSSSVGMATFFFPNGGLVRDFTLTTLLTPIIPLQKIFLLAAELRIIFLVSDLLSSGISLTILRVLRGKAKANQ